MDGLYPATTLVAGNIVATDAHNPVFKFGQLTNSNPNAGVNAYAVVEFDAVVSNSDGAADTNHLDATLKLTDATHATATALFGTNGVDRVNVVEPKVTTDKVITGINQGTDLVTYQITLKNTGDATAYGLALNDVLPATGGSVTGSTGGSWTTNISGPV